MENMHQDQTQQPRQESWGAEPAGRPGPGQPPPPPPYYPPSAGKLPTKSGVLAGILSGILPGLGQIYVGYYQLGFVYALIFAGTVTVLSAGGRAGSGMEPFFGIFLGFFYLYNIIDAVRRAALFNQVAAGLSQTELPSDFQMMGQRGSMIGGIILVVIGTMMFLESKFDISMDWVADWWPLGAVIFGIYLIARSAQSRKS
jgi:hypothetical protein